MTNIGYDQAVAFLEAGWVLHLTMSDFGEHIDRAAVHHLASGEEHTLRRDSAKRIIPACAVICRLTDETAILRYVGKIFDEVEGLPVVRLYDGRWYCFYADYVAMKKAQTLCCYSRHDFEEWCQNHSLIPIV